MVNSTMRRACGHSRGSQRLLGWRGNRQAVEVLDLLGLDAASYSRFENGIRKPPAAIGARIELVTAGEVPATSWYDPALSAAKRKARAA